jgi:hypothetical protein
MIEREAGALMAKMPDPRKNHRHTQAVSGRNDFLVAY